MGEATLTGYAELQDALRAGDAECGAAECHGLMCGMICAAGKQAPSGWLDYILGEEQTPGIMAQQSTGMLSELYASTLAHFNDGDLGLVLLLPDDEAPLVERSRALGEWCQGFLYGLALGGIREDSALPDNVPEIMRDFFEITSIRLDHEAIDAREEAAYMEIVEYVRMSVLLCHEELQPAHVPHRLQ